MPWSNKKKKLHWPRVGQGAREQLSNAQICDAVRTGRTSPVQKVIADGADVGDTDDDGGMPLHMCAAEGFEAAAQLLIDAGADVKFKCNRGHTPLHVARTKGLVQMMLNARAHVGAKCKAGRTPIHCAAGRGVEEVVQCLLDRGANVEAEDNDKRRPLHWAAALDQARVVRLLLRWEPLELGIGCAVRIKGLYSGNITSVDLLTGHFGVIDEFGHHNVVMPHSSCYCFALFWKGGQLRKAHAVLSGLVLTCPAT